MTNKPFEKSEWAKYLQNDMVVVCTADILHQALIHSFITMDKINLLVFDEAHHAKKNHPYAKSVALASALKKLIYSVELFEISMSQRVHLCHSPESSA